MLSLILKEKPVKHAAAPEQGPNGGQEIPDTAYVVRKIDEILAGNAELRAAIAQMEHLEDTPAEALSHMMEARETTNQRLIDLLTEHSGNRKAGSRSRPPGSGNKAAFRRRAGGKPQI